MTDKQWVECLDQITDPVKACQVIVEYERLFGYDPYYADIRKALVRMCERCANMKRR